MPSYLNTVNGVTSFVKLSAKSYIIMQLYSSSDSKK